MLRLTFEVWTGGRREFDFNLFKVMRSLGDKELKVIQDLWGC